jgi:non-ribosomal peptide synthetase component F
MERSVELPIAALGILKAGGAYVALDPADPPQRLSMLLEESGADSRHQSPLGKLPTGKWFVFRKATPTIFQTSGATQKRIQTISTVATFWLN